MGVISIREKGDCRTTRGIRPPSEFRSLNQLFKSSTYQTKLSFSAFVNKCTMCTCRCSVPCLFGQNAVIRTLLLVIFRLTIQCPPKFKTIDIHGWHAHCTSNAIKSAITFHISIIIRLTTIISMKNNAAVSIVSIPWTTNDVRGGTVPRSLHRSSRNRCWQRHSAQTPPCVSLALNYSGAECSSVRPNPPEDESTQEIGWEDIGVSQHYLVVLAA